MHSVKWLCACVHKCGSNSAPSVAVGTLILAHCAVPALTDGTMCSCDAGSLPIQVECLQRWVIYGSKNSETYLKVTATMTQKWGADGIAESYMTLISLWLVYFRIVDDGIAGDV